MRSRALILVSAFLAAVLIGCGGGGGGGKNVTTGTTGVPGATQPGDSIAMENLPNPVNPAGTFNVAYLPLQGRALETFTVLVPSIQLGLGSNTFIEPLSSDISFITNGNQVQQRSTSIPITDTISQPFDTFYLNFDSLIDNQNPGTGVGTTYGSPDDPFLEGEGFPAQIRIFPSRETTLPLFLNDGMFSIDTDNGTASFLPDVFTARNGSPLQSFISDFVSFDVSNMGNNRPMMSNGEKANRAYFSGDKFGLSEPGPTGYFEMLTDDLANPDKGEFTDPVNTGSTTTPGVYRTIVPDPTDPTGQNTITELYGIFRPYVDSTSSARSMVINTGGFEVMLMPKTPDDDTQQILLMTLNGSKVTNLYWGDAHLTSGSFVAFPLADINNGTTAGAIQGTLTGFLDVNAAPVTVTGPTVARNVRYGRYAISGLLPSGFSRSGRFIVFRT